MYIVAHPSNVIDRNIGLATLNTFTLRCLYRYPAMLNVSVAQATDMTSNVNRKGQLYVARHGLESTQSVQPGAHFKQTNAVS